MEKLQSDRDTQISAFCIVFFVIAFPVYFGMASSLTDLGELPGPKGDYEATVVESNLTLGESELNLDDGEPQTISFDTNTIAADLEGSYIAYVRFTISWAETNEQDLKIIAAMKKGSKAILTAKSTRGTRTQDIFSLMGFTAAIEDAEKRCK